MKTKIDTSTYKEINKAKKQKDRDKNMGKYAKGTYGHSIHYRNYRLIMAAIILLFILADVFVSILVFHTRKTVFIIIACILAIPFARNLVDVFMTLKAKPLNKEEYEKTKQLSEKTGKPLLYDLSITQEEGMYYIPCAAVYNNNIIAYTPEIKEAKVREKIKGYLVDANTDDSSYRIYITDKYQTFEKEIEKLREADEETAAIDDEVTYRLLSMGI